MLHAELSSGWNTTLLSYKRATSSLGHVPLGQDEPKRSTIPFSGKSAAIAIGAFVVGVLYGYLAAQS
jgi:hypothetical protein